MWALYNQYGPVARLLLEWFLPSLLVGEIQLQECVKKYNTRIFSKMANFLRADPDVFSENNFGTNDSHTILLLQPSSEGEGDFRHISRVPTLKIATPWIGVMLGLQSAERTQSKGKHLYDWLLRSPSTSTAAGWVFEGRGHGVFHDGGEFSCNRLTSDDALKEAYGKFRATRNDPPSAMRSKTEQLAEFLCQRPLRFLLEKRPGVAEIFTTLNDLSKKLRLGEGSRFFDPAWDNVYLRPGFPNLGAIDSMMISICKHKQPRALFFQLTISKNHPLKAGQLRAVWKALPNEVRLVPPAIIFVVPASLKSSYKVQRIEPHGPPGEDDPSLWPQFVLGLGDAMLWGVTFVEALWYKGAPFKFKRQIIV
jgi:hypothetical protein